MKIKKHNTLSKYGPFSGEGIPERYLPPRTVPYKLLRRCGRAKALVVEDIPAYTALWVYDAEGSETFVLGGKIVLWWPGLDADVVENMTGIEWDRLSSDQRSCCWKLDSLLNVEWPDPKPECCEPSSHTDDEVELSDVAECLRFCYSCYDEESQPKPVCVFFHAFFEVDAQPQHRILDGRSFKSPNMFPTP